MIESLLFVSPIAWAAFWFCSIISVVISVMWLLEDKAISSFIEKQITQLNFVTNRLDEIYQRLVMVRPSRDAEWESLKDELHDAIENMKNKELSQPHIQYRVVNTKKHKITTIIIVLITLLFLMMSQAKSGIINVYAYRAATSETAEKAVETLNSIFDKVSELVK